jgi:hypothetical protein
VTDDRYIVRDLRVLGLASSGDGSAIVTGSIVGTLRFDGAPESTLSAQGNWSAFVARFDPNGALQWARPLRGNDEVLGLGVADAGDDALLFGSFRGDVAFDEGASKLAAVRGVDGFIARYSATGALRWSRTWGGEGDDEARLFTVDATGTAWLLSESTANGQPAAGSLLAERRELFATTNTLARTSSWSSTRCWWTGLVVVSGFVRRSWSWSWATTRSPYNAYLNGIRVRRRWGTS